MCLKNIYNSTSDLLSRIDSIKQQGVKEKSINQLLEQIKSVKKRLALLLNSNAKEPKQADTMAKPATAADAFSNKAYSGTNALEIAKPNIALNAYQISESSKKVIDATNIDMLYEALLDFELIDQGIDYNDNYKKLFTSYKAKMTECVAKAKVKEDEDEIDSLLWDIIKVIQIYLVNNILKGIYRKQKNGKDPIIEQVLSNVQAYLRRSGFYTKNSLSIGNVLCDDDLQYIRYIPNTKRAEQREMEIIEIEYYPYCLEYKDETGEQDMVYTSGCIIVATDK